LVVGNLSGLRTDTSLSNMSPVSLMFSSDEETSRRFGQVLQELDLEVQHCPEIFAAVRKLTSHSFDVIVADWDEGLEAGFLLKTSRELRSNSGAFTIAIGNSGAGAAARQVGADLVLDKPIVPDKAKYALLTCDEFLCHMKTWLPKLGLPAVEETSTRIVGSKAWPAPAPEKHAAEPLPSRPAQPSSAMRGAAVVGYMPVIPAVPIFEDGLFRGSGVQSIIEPHQPKCELLQTEARTGHHGLLRGSAFAVALLGISYVFGESLHSGTVVASMTKIYGRAFGKTHLLLHDSDVRETPAPAVAAENTHTWSPPSGMNSAYARVTRVLHPSALVEARPTNGQPQSLRAEVQPSPRQAPSVTTSNHIPESLKTPISGVTVRSVAAKLTPSLLAAIEPVDLPEELSQKLLLQKVQPSYPEQALRVGLQGPVVLQAWIGRDGTIRDLKLIRGSLLLGQAAYKAVRQWRYQPYLRNGRAVEAQTYVTVDFRLPLISRQ
jgi:TonB family protein